MIDELTRKASKWRSSNSGIEAPQLLSFRLSVLYSNARSAIMFADRYGDLKYYAMLRGEDEDTIRDKYLSDVGLDPNRSKKYDLGNQTAVVHMQKDFSFIVELPDSGKTARSLPKKGSDAGKYEEANDDFSEIKKNVKKIAKNRCSLLFKEFLSGKEANAAKWKESYLVNPLLRSIASLFVWTQGNRSFVLNDDGVISCGGTNYSIGDEPIRLAHPMEMKNTDVEYWQQYFSENDLKQPFAQIWEPVRNESDIKPGRYKGCMIPYYRLRNREKDGITIYDENFHETVVVDFVDCAALVERIDMHRHELHNEDRFEVSDFAFTHYNRQVNHIVAYLDKVTVFERIKKDDASIADILNEFSLAQILEFISEANENGSKNCLALLLQEKNRRWPEYDGVTSLLLE